MPSKKAKKTSRTAATINTEYSDDDDSEDSNTNKKRKRTAKIRKFCPPESPPEFIDDYAAALSDNDIYDEDNRSYLKIANEVVTKNVNLPALFDPNILPGFRAIINKTSKVSAASQLLEASFKVYGKRVDVVHTEARKLDYDVITHLVEEDKKRKNKSVDNIEEENSNESFNGWNGRGEDDVAAASFSEEDEESIIEKRQRQIESMNIDTTFASYGLDENILIQSSMASYSSNYSFQLDDNNDDPRKSLMAFSKNRTLLMGSQRKSSEEIEKRLITANGAAMQYYKNEMLKRGINKGLRKEATGEDERSSEDYSQFHNSYFKYALNKKREKRHICIDDVAATTVDHSRVYVHNEWCDEEDGIPSSLEDKNGPDDGSFLYYPNPICPTQEDDEKEDVDILDGVLEQFQGTLELATASSHKLEDKWVEILGLERKDLRPFNNTNISFEQTANNDFDPDKRLVDRLIIQGEDEAMKAEENRIEKIVRTLYSERIRLPGGPGNTHENSLRRQINSSPSVEIYQNEVIFFPFDQSKYITTESIDAQIAISRCYFIKHSNIKDVKSYGIPDKLFEVLQSYSLPNLPLNDNILRMVETLQNFSFIKCLFTDTVSKFDFNGCCQKLKSEVSPFRIARFAEQLLNSVIHQVKSCNLKPEYFDSSVLPLQSTLSRSSINFAPPPSKIPRLNDTLFNGEGYRYFAAREHQKTIRYPNQIINSENYENQISNLVSKVLSSEKGSAVFLKERITQFFSPEAIYTLLTFLRFYADYRGKDISQFPCHKELPESAQKDLTELPLIEGILKERGALRDIPNIPVFHESAAAPMEIDYDFDNDFNYQDSSTDFYDSLSFSPQQLTAKKSQDIFVNSDNTATTATVEIDHPFENNDETNEFDQNFFNDIRQETIDEASNDSLTKIVNQRFGIPVTRRISTRLKRNAKKIEFVYDDSHWETPADKRAQKKKPIIREELENLHDDNLLFAPRETFSNITTSRCQKSASNSSGMLESARIPRSQDTSLPEVISNKFAYRLELGQTIPGNDDHDKIFMCVRFSEHLKQLFQSNAVLYRGKYSFLPSTSSTRQEDDYVFWLNTYRSCSNLSKIVNSIDDTETYDSGNNYDDVIEHDFDAPSSPHPMHSRSFENYDGSFMREYQPYYNDEDDNEDEEEFDDFDFESRKNKIDVLETSEGKFALKRAIKYILTKSRYDRSTVPDEISGIKVLSAAQNLITSTPLIPKKPSRFEFTYEDEDDAIIAGGGQNHQNDMNVDELGSEGEEESDYENDSDETRMKDFKVNGFHTLKSLLFYLPEICHPDTVRVLSVAHVFCTLCHMANENSLHLIQELVQLDGSTETTSDCRIMNIEDVEIEGNESSLDEVVSSSEMSE